MFFLFIQVFGYVYQNQDKHQANTDYVDIRTIKQLRFYKDEVAQTRKRFNRKVNPQLQPQNYELYPNMIECQNMNGNRQAPRWDCYVPNKKGIEIVDYTISCEGERGDNDFNVLKDSCYIKYDVILSDSGKGQYQQDYQNEQYQKFNTRYHKYSNYYKNGYFNRNSNYQHPIDLRDIQLLTFSHDVQTTSKKGVYFQQLTPLRGNQYTPDHITCRNLQVDQYGQIQWDCRANIPYPYSLEKATVSCERWSNNNDYEIVPGSCMLEYRIDDVSLPDISPFGIFLAICAIVLIAILAFNFSSWNTGLKYQNHNHIHINPPPDMRKKKNDEDSDDKEDRQHAIAGTNLR